MSKARKRANYYLLWSSIIVVLLEMDDEMKGIPIRIPTIEKKLKNLKAGLEKNSEKIHALFSGLEDKQEELQYYRIVNIIERLMKSAEDYDQFSDKLGIIEKAFDKELVLIDQETFNRLKNESK
jgi:glyceraldehyde-3-phosphate dehydrogenase/erythrose-4-phosphate dehydrogenase